MAEALLYTCTQEILTSRGPAILEKAFESAERGDPQMIRLLLPYILREQREKEAAPPNRTLAHQQRPRTGTILGTRYEQSSRRRNPVAEGAKWHDMLEQRRKILATENHEMRLRAIEKFTKTEGV